ncbi:hypothetical protein DFR29_11558 [Tahibacter aquaticus]|uniref:Uncharacterized protein n=1 Tax=Tahibacter aquaticus TaxID=520092 RepID=A0A4R6YPI6_9GAMM|nr:hypothetical protein [Tahibacter aquaticus]TDR39670.1 hypothetical protein DFR29_11558 [Tahibacter aquaticus]
MSATAAAGARPAVPHPSQSSYRATDAGGGWMRFDVVGAVGPTVPAWLLAVGPVVGGCLGFQIGTAQAVGGIIAGLFLAACYVIGRASSLSTFRRHRAPAGSFVVSPQAIRLPSGREIPAKSVHRLVCRNALDGVFILTTGGGSGMAGGAAALGAARHTADANALLPISYQVEVEAEGRSYPLAGCMTGATANAVFEETRRILGLS